MKFIICSKCGKSFPATTEHFHKKKTGKYGLRADCKECCSKRHKIYRENHKKELSEYQKQYRSMHADEKKEYMREYYSKYYEENRDIINKKHIEYNREYIKTPYGKALDGAKRHKKRALRFSSEGTYTPKQWQECLEFFGNKCAYTGEILNSENINIEHIKPLSKGGTNYIWNICPSIYYANLSKGNNDFEEWYKDQKYYSEERLQKIYDWIEYAKFMFQQEVV